MIDRYNFSYTRHNLQTGETVDAATKAKNGKWVLYEDHAEDRIDVFNKGYNKGYDDMEDQWNKLKEYIKVRLSTVEEYIELEYENKVMDITLEEVLEQMEKLENE